MEKLFLNRYIDFTITVFLLLEITCPPLQRKQPHEEIANENMKLHVKHIFCTWETVDSEHFYSVHVLFNESQVLRRIKTQTQVKELLDLNEKFLEAQIKLNKTFLILGLGLRLRLGGWAWCQRSEVRCVAVGTGPRRAQSGWTRTPPRSWAGWMGWVCSRADRTTTGPAGTGWRPPGRTWPAVAHPPEPGWTGTGWALCAWTSPADTSSSGSRSPPDPRGWWCHRPPQSRRRGSRWCAGAAPVRDPRPPQRH